MNQPIVFVTSRLRLRDYRSDASDLAAVLAFVSDPEVATHSAWGPLDEVEALQWLQTVINAQKSVPRIAFPLALVLKSTDEVIGNFGLHIRNVEKKEGELGYTLRRDLWNQGFATEASQALVDFGFQQLGLQRIFATTSPLNIGSQKVLEKIGFEKKTFLEKDVLQRGQWRDSLLYDLMRPGIGDEAKSKSGRKA